MKTLIYTCPYVPAEWIAAHGLRPRRIVCRGANAGAMMLRREGMCPYARAFLHTALTRDDADAVVVTTLCDQMRRTFDLLTATSSIPALLLNVPAMWETTAAFDYYVEQLRRLGRFLKTLGGREPSDDHLIAVMQHYQQARRSILGVQPHLSARRWAELAEDFGRTGPADLDGTLGDRPSVGIPLAIIGGPLFREDFDIYDIIEDNGGRVVFDGTETGHRGWPDEFDAAAIDADPLTALARAYFDGVRDPSRRPNDPLYVWLKAGCQSRSVRGVVCYRHVWCDAWHAELPRMRERLGLPVLDIEARNDGAAEQRTTGRILAFLEMLQ